MSSPRTVLIVDDTSYTRVVLRRILEPEGFTVVAEAADGLEAVELFRRHRPLVVIMDIIMPELDGIEALKRIRGIDPRANVVMCSSIGQDGMLARAIGAGARDYIVKPPRPDKVLAALRAILTLQEDR